ncbi:Unknown protein [Arabidopsis thaliana]|uniref:F15H11.11 protein n=1 Tax=Arabidopsis thaliana TaxID=3702 RepID=Q9SSK6_ARATH|nr:Unknown protein [Arabidopsis thaliana]
MYQKQLQAKFRDVIYTKATRANSALLSSGTTLLASKPYIN